MEVLVLNKNFESVGIVDVFESMIWTDRFDSYGDFELYLFMDELNFLMLQKDYYLWSKDSEHVMIIEDVAIDTDLEEGNHLIVTGRSLESILERRIVWGYKILTGNLQNGIKTLLEENVISPTDEDRKIPNFIFVESTDPIITEMKIDAQYMGDDLYSVISDLCTERGIGFKITLNDQNQFEFRLYAGTDRSYTQDTNPYVIFSPNFDNIINSNYFTSIANYKNVAFVAGEGEGKYKITTIVGSGTGMDRRELFVDASDLSSETEEAILSKAEYLEKLNNKGLVELSQYLISTAFEGEVEASQLFKYGRDFFIGDIVQIIDEYGNEGAAYISELVISQDKEGFTMLPTFKMIQEQEVI